MAEHTSINAPLVWDIRVPNRMSHLERLCHLLDQFGSSLEQSNGKVPEFLLFNGTHLMTMPYAITQGNYLAAACRILRYDGGGRFP